jgi:hypothetical protein
VTANQAPPPAGGNQPAVPPRPLSASSQPLRARPPRRRRPLVLLVLFLLVVAGGFALYVWAALRLSYSDGERAGYVQKFSHKGWLCKTWEGELAMVNLPGALPEIFRFTVRDDAAAAAINRSLGQRVALHYEQHKGVPTSCFGETEYYVDQVRAVGP